jgi:Nucleotidyl transferase AbiEii toxin, Type IV TA system
MLSRLAEAEVDYVVIGGIALILLGSARLTRDLDIVFGPAEENLERLGQVLVGLQARLRDVEEDVPFVPDVGTLRNVELLTLTTSAGWLDVQRDPPGAPPYHDLRRRAERVDVGGFTVLVASPDDLIAMKRAAGRPRDRIDLDELEAIKRLRHQLGRR